MISSVARVAASLLLLSAAHATGPRARRVSEAEVRATLARPVPEGVPADFECAWRAAAYDFARVLQPWRSAAEFAEIHDGLALGACGSAAPAGARAPAPLAVAAPPGSAAGARRVTAGAPGAQPALIVDAARGDDANACTLAAPCRTIAHAVAVGRAAPPPATVLLRAGVHRLASTLALGPADAGLTLAAYNGEAAVVSGGLVLPPPAWAPFRVANATGMTIVAGTNNVYDEPQPGILNYTVTASGDECAAACEGYAGPKGVCTSFTWHDSTYPLPWHNTCWLRFDGRWAPTTEDHHVSGYRNAPANVYVATLPAGAIPDSLAPHAAASFVMSLLYSPDGGATPARATRARYPNSNPELDLYPVGWAGGAKFHAPPVDMNTEVVHVPEPNPDWPTGEFSDYWWGYGGPCTRFASNSSYWCQPNGRVAGATYFVHTPDAGSEGEGTGEDWFLENSFFELDAPNEFFFNFSTRQLFYFHNATAGTPPPAEWTWEVPALDVLVSLAGASDVTISGLTFTSASPTYLAPHDLPSGGDWGLSRLGAVRLEDTQRVTITDCAFTRLDGNAVFVNGRNVNATVTRSSFSWLGESAVALFGYSDGPDVTALNIPLGTSMTDCLCRHIGITEKQVSCFAQNVAARSVVTGNVFWQMPRAAVNYNDWAGGGSLLARNLIWATCLESQDHSAFNSWGRVPYVVPPGFGAPYLIKNNFIVAGGGANGGCADNDDGSSFYEMDSNACIYGAKKSDFNGHSKRDANNIHLFANVYGAKCVGIMDLPTKPGFYEAYHGNVCVLVAGGAYMDLGANCETTSLPAFNVGFLAGNNTVYVDGSGGSVTCGKTYPYAQWAALGLDPGTTLSTTLPTSATMITWVRQLLGY